VVGATSGAGGGAMQSTNSTAGAGKIINDIGGMLMFVLGIVGPLVGL
jgi:hypothetical protein